MFFEILELISEYYQTLIMSAHDPDFYCVSALLKWGW